MKSVKQIRKSAALNWECGLDAHFVGVLGDGTCFVVLGEAPRSKNLRCSQVQHMFGCARALKAACFMLWSFAWSSTFVGSTYGQPF